jgi:hypothetical protein
MERQPQTPTTRGPAEWFTGDVYVDPIARQPRVDAHHSRLRLLHAVRPHRLAPPHRRPEALLHRRRRIRPSPRRTAHSLRPGDIVVTQPNEWHWHGATTDRFMVHLAFTEGDTEWGEHSPTTNTLPDN